ncbi:hypothetical protein NDU88_005440 [Pleurodeles waltl]|uniref:Uncharacterized protein n=1 Tax=Pleurodeles waltl TaxID=8319 RepID=A0AAV7PGV5_PLEWA|nr:hypothetical protein NDU88_005440 [Pleurodeles waltl]
MQSCAQASRPPSRPGGRFRHRAHFAVTRGALSRLAPSCNDPLCPPISAPTPDIDIEEVLHSLEISIVDVHQYGLTKMYVKSGNTP